MKRITCFLQVIRFIFALANRRQIYAGFAPDIIGRCTYFFQDAATRFVVLLTTSTSYRPRSRGFQLVFIRILVTALSFHSIGTCGWSSWYLRITSPVAKERVSFRFVWPLVILFYTTVGLPFLHPTVFVKLLAVQHLENIII
jgi:hypothetical protein